MAHSSWLKTARGPTRDERIKTIVSTLSGVEENYRSLRILFRELKVIFGNVSDDKEIVIAISRSRFWELLLYQSITRR